MTWEITPQTVFSALSAIAILAGLIVTIRGVIRASAEGGGVLKQQVESLEKRVGSMESDVRELRKGQTDMLVALGKIPEQLHGMERQMTMQHDAATHSARNLRASIEALARRAGVIPSPDG